MTLRIGLTPYLNARPFVLGFLGRPGVELVQASPARICDLLRQGWIDAGLTSSTAYYCGDYRIIPSSAISAVGRGADAVLVGNVPLAHMRTIALSQASRSTNLLLRLVFHWLLPDRAITFHLRPEDPLRSLHEADGCLLIGDAAIETGVQAAFRYNLADIWLDHSGGKPLPLSCWLAKPDASLELTGLIRDATAEGVALLPEIAREAASTLKIIEEAALAYLSESLSYAWGTAQAESLCWFANELHKIGALKCTCELNYLGEPSPTPA